MAFGMQPLHHETAGEEYLSDEAEDGPEIVQDQRPLGGVRTQVVTDHARAGDEDQPQPEPGVAHPVHLLDVDVFQIAQIDRQTDHLAEGDDRVPPRITSYNVCYTKLLRAAITLLGDSLKGFVPMLVAHLLDAGPLVLALTGMAAFLGHLYPVFFGFKGGKGVATALGVQFA